MSYFEVKKLPPITTPTVTGAVCSFDSVYAGLPLKSHAVEVVATQSGSGTPSPSNPRAISGYSAINIRATGTNLWGGLDLAGDFDGKANNYNLDTTNKFFTYGRAISSPYQTPLFDRFKPNTVYTIIWTCRRRTASGSNDSLRIRYTDNTTEGILCSSDTKQTIIVTTNSNKSVKDIYIGYNATAITECYYDESGVFEGTLSADDFVAYNGQSITVQIGSTVFAGTYDAITGILTVEWKGVDLGSLTWTYQSQYARFISNVIADISDVPNVRTMDIMCSCYQTIKDGRPLAQVPDYSIYNSGESKQLNVHDSRYTSGTDLATALSGQYATYLIRHLETIQLSPAQILTLMGQNNIWADTGDTTLQYFKFG